MPTDLKLLLILLPLLMLAAPGFGGNGNWQELRPELQTLLGEYRDDWPGLDADTRAKLLQNGERWLALPESRRSVLWQRFQRWEAMTPDKRMSMEQAYERFTHLPESERHRLMGAHNMFQQMPPEKQRLMMQRFEEFQRRSGHMLPSESMGSMGDMSNMMEPGSDMQMPAGMESMDSMGESMSERIMPR